jgi:general secretion pathway protein G
MYDFSNFFCSKKQGFTFVEILVACSIIIALAVGAIFLGSAILDNGRYNKAKTDTATISTAIGQYKFELGSFPKSIDDLTKKDGQYGHYLSSDILKDPWGNDYHFSVNTSTSRFAVWSNGHNKTNDTGSFNDSISGDDIGIMGH